MQHFKFFHPTIQELRVFAALQLPFFAVLFLMWNGWNWPSWTLIFMTCSLIVALVGQAAPWLIKPIYIAWMAVVAPIGWVVSHLILAVVYYFVVTPIGWYRVWRTGDPMQRRFDPHAETYWQPRSQNRNAESYFRQF